MITFKKLIFTRSQSRGSDAYTADVYWSGRKLGHIRNDGNGGMSHLLPASPAAASDIAAATAFAKGQKMRAKIGDREHYDYLEDYIDDVAFETDHRKYVTRWLKRSVKCRIVLITDGQVRTSRKASPEAPLEALRVAVAKRHPDARIVNDLPEAEALQALLGTKSFGLDGNLTG